MRVRNSLMVVLAVACLTVLVVVLVSRKERRQRSKAFPHEENERKGTVGQSGERQAIGWRTPRRKDFLWGEVVDAEGNEVPEVLVEAGVFEGESAGSLTQKVFVRSTTTGGRATHGMRRS